MNCVADVIRSHCKIFQKNLRKCFVVLISSSDMSPHTFIKLCGGDCYVINMVVFNNKIHF